MSKFWLWCNTSSWYLGNNIKWTPFINHDRFAGEILFYVLSIYNGMIYIYILILTLVPHFSDFFPSNSFWFSLSLYSTKAFLLILGIFKQSYIFRPLDWSQSTRKLVPWGVNKVAGSELLTRLNGMAYLSRLVEAVHILKMSLSNISSVRLYD